MRELQSLSAAEALTRLDELLSNSRHVTLVFASKNVEHNNAVVLKEVVEAMRPRKSGKPAKSAHTRRSHRTTG